MPLDDGGWEMEVQLPRRDLDRLMKQHPDLRNTLVA
jgi:hypothetical protein